MKIPMIPRPSAIRELRANSSPTSLPTLSLCSTRNFASGNFSSSSLSIPSLVPCALRTLGIPCLSALSVSYDALLQIDLLQRRSDVAFVDPLCASITSRSPPLKSMPKFFSPRAANTTTETRITRADIPTDRRLLLRKSKFVDLIRFDIGNALEWATCDCPVEAITRHKQRGKHRCNDADW